MNSDLLILEAQFILREMTDCDIHPRIRITSSPYAVICVNRCPLLMMTLFPSLFIVFPLCLN